MCNICKQPFDENEIDRCCQCNEVICENCWSGHCHGDEAVCEVCYKKGLKRYVERRKAHTPEEQFKNLFEDYVLGNLSLDNLSEIIGFDPEKIPEITTRPLKRKVIRDINERGRTLIVPETKIPDKRGEGMPDTLETNS